MRTKVGVAAPVCGGIRATPSADRDTATTQPRSELLQLAYRSVAVSDFGHLHLFHLLREIERTNHRQGITGHLQYRSGVFMQYIEGPTLAVEHLWLRIQKDRRHRSIDLLRKHTGEGRKLVDWSMSFAVSPAYKRLGVPGFIALDDGGTGDAILQACLR